VTPELVAKPIGKEVPEVRDDTFVRGWIDSMRISRGLFLVAIVGSALLGYGAARLRNFFPFAPSSGSATSSGERYYLVMPNVGALIDHKKVSANPNRAEWQTDSMPMTKEECEAKLREHSELGVGIASQDAQPQRNVQIDVTNLRRCVPADRWDSLEKYSPDPKDVFRP
jgi:hypothetical protein